MKYIAVLFWIVAAVGCSCSSTPVVSFPEEVGQKRFLPIATGHPQLISAVSRDGTHEALLAFLEDTALRVRQSDGGVHRLMAASTIPHELAIAVQAGRSPDYAFGRRKQPYGELLYSHGGITESISETGGAAFSPKLGWLPDGDPYLVAAEQGLTGCASSPVIVQCGGTPCSSRCLNVVNAGAAMSVLGGVVIAVSGAGLSLFQVSRATFDGGAGNVFADRVFNLDAGMPIDLAISPDGTSAVALVAYPQLRLVFFAPLGGRADFETGPAERCEPRAILASRTHAIFVCRTRREDQIVAQMSLFTWSGELVRTIELGEDNPDRYVVPHRDQIIVGTVRDGGMELERVY